MKRSEMLGKLENRLIFPEGEVEKLLDFIEECGMLPPARVPSRTEMEPSPSYTWEPEDISEEEIELAALTSLKNFGAPLDIYHPDYGFILRNGKATENSRKFYENYKNQGDGGGHE